MAEKPKAKTPSITPESVLIVTAIKDGFRRGGRAWHGTTEALAREFMPDQLEQILTEPLLRVEIKA